MTKITGWMRTDQEGARGVTVAADRYVEVKLTTEGREANVTVWWDGRVEIETKKNEKRETTITIGAAVLE